MIAHILKVLRLRWLVIALCGALGLTLAVLYALFWPSTYQATASVVAVVQSPETLGSRTIAEQLSSDYLLTQEDILKSERVARQVVARTGLAKAPGAAERFGWDPSSGPLDEVIARQISGGLNVASSAVNSRVIEISYLSSDPVFSAQMANAFATAFIDVNVDLQGEPARRTVAAYTRQLDAIAKQMTERQKALAAKERQLGIVSSKGESDPDSAQLAALSSGLAGAQAQSAAAASRARGAALPDALSSPVVQSLQTEIARVEGQRQLLQTTLGANHPDYKQLVSQLAGLRGQLAAQQRLIRESAAAAAAQAKAAEGGLNSAVNRQRDQVIRARADQNEVSVMEQDLANLRTSYDQVAQRRAQLLVLGSNAENNISLLSKATVDTTPVAPRRLRSVLAGLILGLALGVAIVLALEFLDRRIRLSSQLETLLGIPDLGSIRPQGHRQTQLPRFVAGLLPSAKH